MDATPWGHVDPRDIPTRQTSQAAERAEARQSPYLKSIIETVAQSLRGATGYPNGAHYFVVGYEDLSRLDSVVELIRNKADELREHFPNDPFANTRNFLMLDGLFDAIPEYLLRYEKMIITSAIVRYKGILD